jgi:hypothetical protein
MNNIVMPTAQLNRTIDGGLVVGRARWARRIFRGGPSGSALPLIQKLTNVDTTSLGRERPARQNQASYPFSEVDAGTPHQSRFLCF